MSYLRVALTNKKTAVLQKNYPHDLIKGAKSQNTLIKHNAFQITQPCKKVTFQILTAVRTKMAVF